jgi:hypothetical protein
MAGTEEHAVNHLDVLTLGSMSDEIVAVMFFGVAGCIAVVAIVSSAVRSVLTHRQTEQSRREIAAYVAEGSMTPEDGMRLLATATPTLRK